MGRRWVRKKKLPLKAMSGSVIGRKETGLRKREDDKTDISRTDLRQKTKQSKCVEEGETARTEESLSAKARGKFSGPTEEGLVGAGWERPLFSWSQCKKGNGSKRADD